MTIAIADAIAEAVTNWWAELIAPICIACPGLAEWRVSTWPLDGGAMTSEWRCDSHMPRTTPAEYMAMTWRHRRQPQTKEPK